MITKNNIKKITWYALKIKYLVTQYIVLASFLIFFTSNIHGYLISRDEGHQALTFESDVVFIFQATLPISFEREQLLNSLRSVEFDYLINPNLVSEQSGTTAEQLTAIRASANVWFQQTLIQGRLNYRGTSIITYAQSYEPDDDDFNVVFGNIHNTKDMTALATAYRWSGTARRTISFLSTGTQKIERVYQWHIAINDPKHNFNHDIVNNPGGGVDLQAVMVHEFGHILGLAHCRVGDSATQCDSENFGEYTDPNGAFTFTGGYQLHPTRSRAPRTDKEALGDPLRFGLSSMSAYAYNSPVSRSISTDERRAIARLYPYSLGDDLIGEISGARGRVVVGREYSFELGNLPGLPGTGHFHVGVEEITIDTFDNVQGANEINTFRFNNFYQGEPYNIRLLSSPAGQTCDIVNNTGVYNRPSIVEDCSERPDYVNCMNNSVYLLPLIQVNCSTVPGLAINPDLDGNALVWQKCSAGQSFIYEDNLCRGSAAQINWYGAEDYCKNLTLSGYSDWRLPSVKDFASIIDCRGGNQITYSDAKYLDFTIDYPPIDVNNLPDVWDRDVALEHCDFDYQNNLNGIQSGGPYINTNLFPFSNYSDYTTSYVGRGGIGGGVVIPRQYEERIIRPPRTNLLYYGTAVDPFVNDPNYVAPSITSFEMAETAYYSFSTFSALNVRCVR